ncbi:MAG: ABC transporter permease [Planctomycetes bacterium]|nr:ABC transporter permease [Planctomycetota bacterium]
MRLWSISVRNLRIRAVASGLTILAIVVATGLYAAILMMAEQTEQRYKGSVGGYQAVVGPKDASQLEIVLNTIFHVGDAPGLIPLQTCIDLRSGRIGGRRSAVRYAIPQARGDSVSQFNFPVIATIDEMFTTFERGGKPLPFAQGGPFEFSFDDMRRVADELAAHETAVRTGADEVPPRPVLGDAMKRCVVGHRVHKKLGLALGDVVTPVHGKMGEFGFHPHPEAACEVTGILEPTNSPIDSTIFLPLGTHWLIDGHEAGVFVVEVPPGKNPDDAAKLPVNAGQLGLTAIVCDPKDYFGAQFLRREFGKRGDAQVSWPQDVVPKFLRNMGSIADALLIIAWLVLFGAALSISAVIYNTMNERRREIAIMRSLGARRAQIFAIIVLEAGLLSLWGGALGLLACHLTAFGCGGLVEDMTGVYLDWLQVGLWELWLVLGVTGIGAFAGLLPAIKGSRTQVADSIAQNY